jgi:hypothetical protein
MENVSNSKLLNINNDVACRRIIKCNDVAELRNKQSVCVKVDVNGKYIS